MPTGSWIIRASVLLLAFLLARGSQDEEGDNNQGKTNDVKNKDNINTPKNVASGGSTTVKHPLDITMAPYSPTCGVPPPDACANINVGEIDTTGNMASYTCKSPYKLTGQQSLVCSRTGSWDRINSTKDWPSCKVDCGPAPHEPMAWVTAEGYGNHSARVPWATYQCNTSYSSAVSPSNTKNISCDPYTLEWERPNLHCTAPQHEMTVDKSLSFLVDRNHSSCVNFTHDGSAVVHFNRSMEVYDITLQAISSGDISLNMSLMNVDIETTNWQEPRILKTAWPNGKVFPWVDNGTLLVGTSLNVTLLVMEQGSTFSFCELEVTGRPHLADCTKPPPPRYGQQLRGVKSGRCDPGIGSCAHGTQVEYECQKGFLQTSGEAVVTCEGSRNWSELTLNCDYAPVVKVLLSSTEENRCTPVNTSIHTFSMEHLELYTAVANISVANTTKASNILAKGNSRIYFEYLLSSERITCDIHNLTAGTSLYAFDCVKRPVARSVQLRIKFDNALSEMSICFIKVIARNYDKALECMEASPGDYKGRLNIAYTGETCDFWSSRIEPNETVKGESLESAANFCRNLKNSRSLPWCFIKTTPVVCPVVACNEACVFPWSTDGAEYVGQQDFETETEMSWNCLGWNETSHTDVCPVLQKSMFADGISNTSYCRNPDRRTTGPWCNVRPCLQGGCSPREMNCRVPTCPNTDQIENGTINVLNDTEKFWFLKIHLVECWVYNSGSMERYGMPHGQAVTMDAIEKILHTWCAISNGKNFLATCHNITNWYRVMLLCDKNITSSVDWTSSILPTLSTKDVSSTFFIKETASTKDTLITPSMTPSYSVTRQTQEFVRSHSWYSYSTQVTQTVAIIGPMTTLRSGYRPSSSSAHEYITAQTINPVSLSQTVTSRHGINLNTANEIKYTETIVKSESTITFQSRITPSSKSRYEHISTQTVSVSYGQTTSRGINRSHKVETNSTQTVTPANRGQTTTLQSGSTPSSSPTHVKKAANKHCPCWCSGDKPADSLQESATQAAKLSQFLHVQKDNLSKTINGKISKNDKRDSARLISYLFTLVIIIMVLSVIILPDVLSVIIYMSNRSPPINDKTSVPEK